MKYFLSVICSAVSFIVTAQTGGVGIGTAAPDNNAILELKSTNKALLLPRLSSSNLNGLAGKEGMIAYDHDAHVFSGYIGTTGIPVTTNFNPAGGLQLTTTTDATQTYTAPSTFKLQDIGVMIFAPGTPTTFTIKVYQGNGIAGTLLGTKSTVIPMSNGGLRYLDFTSDNITCQAGQTYTFQLTANVNGSLFYANNNLYSGGILGYNGGTYPNYDMVFEVRSAGAGKWSPLATAESLQGKVAAAFGSVTGSGIQIITSSGGYSLAHPSAGNYTVIFNVESPLYNIDISTMPVTATLSGSAPGMITYGGSGNVLNIYTFNTAGVATDRGFTFMISKP